MAKSGRKTKREERPLILNGTEFECLVRLMGEMARDLPTEIPMDGFRELDEIVKREAAFGSTTGQWRMGIVEVERELVDGEQKSLKKTSPHHAALNCLIRVVCYAVGTFEADGLNHLLGQVEEWAVLVCRHPGDDGIIVGCPLADLIAAVELAWY